MKIKLFFLSLAFSLSFQINAQIGKGTVLVGSTTNLLGSFNTIGLSGFDNNASIQFGKQKSKYEDTGFDFESEYSVTSFNVSPTAGAFVTDNILLGASVGFWIYRLKDEDDDKDGFTATSFAPFVRGYFKTEGKALPFAEVRGGLMNIKFVESDDPADNLSFFSVKAGSSFFIGNRTSLDLFASYNYSRNKEEFDEGSSTDTSNYFGIGVGLSVFINNTEGGD